MLYFLKFSKKYWPHYLVAFSFVLITTFINASFPLLIQNIIDNVIINKEINKAFVLIASLFILYIIHGFSIYGYIYLADYIAEKVTYDIRKEIFNHSCKQNGVFFKENSPSELMSRNIYDAGLIGFSYGFRLLFSVEIVIHEIVMIICLINMNIYLSIVPLLIMPIIGVLAYKEEVIGNKLSCEISDETALMNKTAGEAVGGIRTVKAYGKENVEKRRFAERNNHFFNLNQKLEKNHTKYDSIIATISRMMLVFVILIGGLFVIYNKITLGELAAYIEYTNSLVWPMLEIGWIISMYAESIASANKIKRVLFTHTEVKAVEPVYKLEDTKFDLEFSNVSFTTEDHSVLKDINIKLEKGKTIGIMGPTGSGKTTLINLLTRFIEPSAGEIKINGKNIRHYDVQELRKAISCVNQEVFLFSQTIRENLKKGKMDELSDEEMIKISSLFEVNKFVKDLKAGYDTVIGERGVGLSGGQKQRISIARAILKDSPLLVLDDATSALDMATEKIIQTNLDSLNKTFSKIIIAHRVSSVKNADEIIYLENGEITERGNHDELLRLKGNYYKTYQVQMGGLNEF